MQLVSNPKALFSSHDAISIITFKIIFLQCPKRFGGEHSLEVIYWEHCEPTNVCIGVMSKAITFSCLNNFGKHCEWEVSLLLSILWSAKILLFRNFG